MDIIVQLLKDFGPPGLLLVIWGLGKPEGCVGELRHCHALALPAISIDEGAPVGGRSTVEWAGMDTSLSFGDYNTLVKAVLVAAVVVFVLLSLKRRSPFEWPK